MSVKKKQKSKYDILSEERKKLQKSGKAPEWYSTGGYQILKTKYLDDLNPLQKYKLITKTAAKHLPKEIRELAQSKFFELFWKGWLSPSSPIISNMGTDKGLPVSCSGSDIDDSVYGFYDSEREAAVLTQNGFGTSGYLGNIRPRGSKISRGGTASGVMPVFKDFVQIMRDIAQGTARRGAWAGYIEPEHGDFDEIIHYVENEPDDVNVGWVITDKFIAALDAGDTEMTRRFQRIMKVKMVTGKGYFFFVDKANRLAPDVYKELGLHIKASNLCFSGETMIAVADGRNAVSIKELAESREIFTVYSAEKDVDSKWSKVVRQATAFKTGERTVVEITLDDGDTFRCTPDHQLATSDGKWIEAANSFGATLQSFNDITGREVVGIDVIGVEAVYDITVSVTDDNYDKHSFYIITDNEYDNFVTSRGVLVHNCSEIFLHSDPDHTFTCVLSSMNLAKYDEWKDTDAVYWATIFLDCVASDFIKRGKKIKGIEKAVRSTEKGRPVGLGVMGYHTLFQIKRIPFESAAAVELDSEIFAHLDAESLRASQYLAKLLGEPEWCKGKGIRNTHRIAIAPTKTSAAYMGGQSEGINPDPAMVFVQSTSAGEIFRINPQFLEFLKENGKYTDELIKEIHYEHNGSVQFIDWMSDHDREVFKTAFEINQEAIINLASNRQLFIDQGQSLNLFFDADEDEEYIAYIHKLAFKNEFIKALYYIYSQAGVSASKGICEACS